MNRIIGILILAVCLLPGCTKSVRNAESLDPFSRQYTAIATVKRDAASRVFIQLDEETILYPDNYPDPFVRECRIVCAFSWKTGTQRCWMAWMDYIEEGTVQGGDLPEGDPIEPEHDWMTSVEDAYLTLHYSAFWGDGRVAHSLILVTGENPEDPYEVRLVHLCNGDPAIEKGDALVYFDLSSLPPTGEGGEILTLKWKNSAGGFDSRSYLFKSRQ